MSFSKAKIQRFNDVKACITGSNKQNSEKHKSKQKVGTLHQCNTSADKDKSDTASSHSVPCFRTPVLLKKKLKSTISNNIPNSKSTPLLPADQNVEALKEKLVEIQNKDAYIEDLTQQLDDFKEKINNIERDKQNIENEKLRYEKIIENLTKDHENKIATIQTDFQNRLIDTVSLKDQISKQLLFLKDDFQKFQSFYTNDIQDLKNHFSELPIYLKKYSDHYQALFDQKQSELDHQENILKVIEQNSIEMQQKHSLEIEKLIKEQQTEIQDLEFEMLRTMMDLQKEKEVSLHRIQEMEETMKMKLGEMKTVFEYEKQQIQSQAEIKTKQLEDSLKNVNSNAETHLKEKLTDLETQWKKKLLEQEEQAKDILKECQAISEYNIIQCTIEKNTVTAELQENVEELKRIKTNYEQLGNRFKELKLTYESLKDELTSKKKELDDFKKEVKTEIDQYSKKFNQALREKSTYEFTIKNSQVTIEVLTKRLIHSDKDVEQLKEELSVCEERLLDYEQRNLQLTTELKQAQALSEDLEMQFESTIKLNCKDIDNMGIKLLKEVNDYKKEVILYKKRFKDEQDLKKEIMQQLHDAYDMVSRLKMEFENAESVCSQYKFEVEQSQNELEDYYMREMDWNIIKDKLESTIKELEDLLESKTCQIADLKNKIESLEQKSDSVSQRSDYYKQIVAELKQDQVDTGRIHKKYVELSGKYDVLFFKYEELKTENLQNKMKLLKIPEEQSKDDLKKKYDEQMLLNSELEEKNGKLEQELQKRLKEESRLKSDYTIITTERDALMSKVQQLEKELSQRNLDSKQSTTKKSKKIKNEDKDPKKWIKKTKHPKGDKENLNSPNRTLTSGRIDSPLRDRN